MPCAHIFGFSTFIVKKLCNLDPRHRGLFASIVPCILRTEPRRILARI